MLKIVYEGKNYNYGNVGGNQPYDINTEIKVVEDANLSEAFRAFITALDIAGYHIERSNVVNAVEDAMDEIEY